MTQKSIFDTYMVKIDVSSEGNVWLSGSKQGWQPRGRWFKLSWGQSLFVGGNVRLGALWDCGRDWEDAASFFSSFFLNIKKKKENYDQNPGIIPPKFLWTFNHSFNVPWPQKTFFFDPEKKKIWPHFFFFFFLNLLFKYHRNYGGIMPGFGTWWKSIVFMVKTFAVQTSADSSFW